MKVAVSLPDDLFQAADRAARRQRMSRSALYAKAIKRYLAAAEAASVRERLDQVYGAKAPGLDPGLAALQWASWPGAQEPW